MAQRCVGFLSPANLLMAFAEFVENSIVAHAKTILWGYHGNKTVQHRLTST